MNSGKILIRSGGWSTDTKLYTLLFALVHVTTAWGRVMVLLPMGLFCTRTITVWCFSYEHYTYAMLLSAAYLLFLACSYFWRRVLVGGFKYPTQGRVHSVARYANSRRPSVHHRVGRKNFPERIPFARRMNGRVQKKRQSFWDRSEQRQDNYRVENRYRREGRFVNPLDRFTQAPQRGYGYRMRPGNRQAQGFRYNRYNNNNNRMNGNYGRTNRRALDRELDGYMQKSARYNRARLDEDMDKYMSGTKAYLDKQMDEYMSAKKKNTAIQGM